MKNNVNILIVEDEAISALALERMLVKMGFNVVDKVSNYENAIHSVKTKHPNLILLDIHLKKSKSGIEVAKTIREIDDIPIIYLTGDADEHTIHKAIQTDPIAYLCKPFRREDLKSTILLSMYKISHKHKIITDLKELGCNYYYDVKNKNLFFKKYPIKLSPQERSLLDILVDAEGEIVPFSRVEECIWIGRSVSNSALRTLIHRMRIKLEYKLIETVKGFGYRLILAGQSQDDC